MDDLSAHALVSRLAGGRDPATNQPLATGTWQYPDVLRALAVAAEALEARVTARARRDRLPPNVGKPWSATDDALLLEGFEAGRTVPELALELGRTSTGIRARLERHGRLPPTPGRR